MYKNSTVLRPDPADVVLQVDEPERLLSRNAHTLHHMASEPSADDILTAEVWKDAP